MPQAETWPQVGLAMDPQSPHLSRLLGHAELYSLVNGVAAWPTRVWH